MSASGDGGGREVAYRLFAAEYDDADVEHAESDEERAPNYVITPTGARVNRLFVVGTLTEVTQVNEEMVRARVVDPTGAFVVYAGQYQPDELAALERIEPPAFVAVTGKARTFQPDDSEAVYTSVRPESVNVVDADTRNRWVVAAAEGTVDRIGTYAAAADVDAGGDALTETLLEADVREGLAEGIALARNHYGTTPAYLAGLRALALDAARVVAGDLDEVDPFDLRPDDAGAGQGAGDAEFAALAGTADVDVAAADATGRDESVGDEPVADDEPIAEPSSDEGRTDTPTESASADEQATATATDEEVSTTDDARPGGESAGEPDEPAVSAEASSETTDSTSAADRPSRSDGAPNSTADEIDAESAPTGQGETESTPSDDATTGAETEAHVSTTVDGDLGSVDDSDSELGEFESAGSGEMYEMDDEEREELEAEFGAEFTSGSDIEGSSGAADASTDVDSEADLETDESTSAGPPESAGGDLEADDAGDETDTDAGPETDDAGGDVTEETRGSDDTAAAPTDEESTDSTEDGPADVDLEEFVVDAMRNLDDGDGADRDAVVGTVAEEADVPADEVEDAIQDALMGGQCYEPDDETLKAI